VSRSNSKLTSRVDALLCISYVVALVVVVFVALSSDLEPLDKWSVGFVVFVLILMGAALALRNTEPAEAEPTQVRLPPEACTARLHYQNHPRPWGKPGHWRAAFREAMSSDEAKVLLGDQSPLNALGLTPGASRAEIKRAWHEMAMKWHPDHNRGNEKEATEQFKRCKAAYLTLTGRA
jgi:hypothetical protein